MLKDSCMRESYQINVTYRVSSIDAEIEIVPNTDREDYVFNYYSNFMKVRLLERNFRAVAAEMDSEKLLHSWKFNFLNFRDAGRTKRALTSLSLSLASLRHMNLIDNCRTESSTFRVALIKSCH